MIRSWLIATLLVIVSCELLVTKEYTEYLKKHGTWQVREYEDNIFRGWTIDEARLFLGATLPNTQDSIPSLEPTKHIPSALNWAGASCDHGVRNQGQCASSWALASVGMLSYRCCLQGHDRGWLSPQEVLSCDSKSHGCNGGWCTWALDYVMSKGGLCPEACFPYKAQNLPCPTKCVDNSQIPRYCNCVGGYKTATSVEAIKTALQSGPVTLTFEVCRSFFYGGWGIYKCDCGTNIVGLHAVLGIGYSDTPISHFYCRNSWGSNWGVQGYFYIASNTCGISGKYPNGNVVCEKVES